MRRKRRIYAIAIISAILVVAAILKISARYHGKYLSCSLKIESNFSKRNAVPLIMEVDPNGQIYTLENVKGALFVRLYSTQGRYLWQKKLPINIKLYNGIITSFPGSRPSYVWLYESNTHCRLLWIYVNDNHELRLSELQTSTNPITYAFIIPTDGGICAYGNAEDDSDHLILIKLDLKGLRKWVAKEESGNINASPVIDNAGNIILGFNDFGVGQFIVKYSPNGKRLWQSSILYNECFLTNIEVDKQGLLHVITSINHNIPLTTLYEDLFFSTFDRDNCSSDHDFSGWKQDYVINTYNPQGKLLRTTQISNGAWFNYEDSTINSRGELFILGNRKKVNMLGFPGKLDNAQIIKCDSKGNVLWSRPVKLPDNSVAACIRTDKKDGIYILGSKKIDYPDGAPKPSAKSFIYKINDPN